MKENILNLLNRQINAELYSSYLYLAFANFFDSKGYKGFAHWYKVQALEEIGHANLIYDYLHSNNEEVSLSGIEKPEDIPETISTIAERGLEHEKHVTRLIHNLFSEAQNAKDYRTMKFLGWFINEQAEEEENANEVISKINICTEKSCGLYLLDKEMNKRIYKKHEI